MVFLLLKSQCRREVPVSQHMAFKQVKNGIICAPNSNLIKRIPLSILKYRNKLFEGIQLPKQTNKSNYKFGRESIKYFLQKCDNSFFVCSVIFKYQQQWMILHMQKLGMVGCLWQYNQISRLKLVHTNNIYFNYLVWACSVKLAFDHRQIKTKVSGNA